MEGFTLRTYGPLAKLINGPFHFTLSPYISGPFGNYSIDHHYGPLLIVKESNTPGSIPVSLVWFLW